MSFQPLPVGAQEAMAAIRGPGIRNIRYAGLDLPWFLRRRQGLRFEVPMGQGIDRRDLPRQAGSVPQVDGQAPRTPADVLSAPIVRRTTPSNGSQLQQQTTEETVDLGNILGAVGQAVDIYGRYRGYRTPDYPIMGRGLTQSWEDARMQTVEGPVVGSDTFGVSPRSLGGVSLYKPVISGSMAAKIAQVLGGLGLGLAADEIATVANYCAKVKGRRRRKRLATHSDIKDLAALKAVLGSGKAFDTWIATRKM